MKKNRLTAVAVLVEGQHKVNGSVGWRNSHGKGGISVYTEDGFVGIKGR